MDLVPSNPVEGGVFGTIGVAIGTFFAMFIRRKKSTSDCTEHINARADKTDSLLESMTAAITKLVDIGERQELLSTKIWEEILRREAKE